MDKELLLLLNEHMMKEFDAYFQYLATASFFEKKEWLRTLGKGSS